jgi:uridine kinase
LALFGWPWQNPALDMANLPNITEALALVESARRATSRDRAVLAAVSGIDGSGKGFVAGKMAGELRAAGFQTVVLNVDGWLNLPEVRFDKSNPAETFYERALRFEEMFATLIFPLRDLRSIHVEVNHTEETARDYVRKRYDFEAVDIILLEGIFLLKRAFQDYYDLAFWVECGFETALNRAILRGQENLPREETIRAYETIYFPAQKIHLERDDPRGVAKMIDNSR